MISNTLHDHKLEASGSGSSGVSWGAIFAGAFAAAALSFVLVILGFGLGFSSVSPWSGSGLSAQAIGYSTIIWVAFTQIAASAIGGYIAGRLRVKWTNIHNDEVYFRDTAHGFLAWAVASLATAALLSSAFGSVLAGGAKVAGSAGAAVVAVGGAGMASEGSGNATDGVAGYFVDSLFRPAATSTAAPVAADSANVNSVAVTEAPAVTPAQRAEVTRIFANAIRVGSLPDADKSYLTQLLAKRTGMSQANVEKRINEIYATYKKNVDDGIAKAKEAADSARKAAAYGSLWMFVALLCGAFVASFTATYGGRLRDRIVDDSPRINNSTNPATLS